MKVPYKFITAFFWFRINPDRPMAIDFSTSPGSTWIEVRQSRCMKSIAMALRCIGDPPRAGLTGRFSSFFSSNPTACATLMTVFVAPAPIVSRSADTHQPGSLRRSCLNLDRLHRPSLTRNGCYARRSRFSRLLFEHTRRHL